MWVCMCLCVCVCVYYKTELLSDLIIDLIIDLVEFFKVKVLFGLYFFVKCFEFNWILFIVQMRCCGLCDKISQKKNYLCKVK